jgi:hypothetical protein
MINSNWQVQNIPGKYLGTIAVKKREVCIVHSHMKIDREKLCMNISNLSIHQDVSFVFSLFLRVMCLFLLLNISTCLNLIFALAKVR